MKEPYIEIINACNKANLPIIAIDVPSGMTGDEGGILAPCIHANVTISMGYGKIGSLREPARSHCGITEIIDIGFPRDSHKDIGDEIMIQALEYDDFQPFPIKRSSDVHKYKVGKIGVIAGSKGYSGAAIMSALTSLKSGAGITRLAVPESIGQIAEMAEAELIVSYEKETADGAFSRNALDSLVKLVKWSDTLVLGPGIGRNDETVTLVHQILKTCNTPLVLDADGIFAASQAQSLIKSYKNEIILTPHWGEFKFLVASVGDIWKQAQSFAKEMNCHLILKGAPTIYCNPTGDVFVNSTGNPGMATAGSGDILSGLLASFIAQGNDIEKMIQLAIFLHGTAGDFAAMNKGEFGLMAGDIIENIPDAIYEMRGL